MDDNFSRVVLVRDINPDVFYNDYYYVSEPNPQGSYPGDLTDFSDRLYFTANDGENGRELFVSDGTTEGTELVTDINPGFSNSDYHFDRFPYGSYAKDFIEFNNRLYFTASDGESGSELFVTDGTTERTELVADINPGFNTNYGSAYSSYPTGFVEFADRLYFTADNGTSGSELFVTDGTASGTQLLIDLVLGNNGYGYNYSSKPSNLIQLGDRLYFTANDGVSGNELWSTDGTAEGTQLVADIFPGTGSNNYIGTYPQSSYASEFVEFDGRLYFAANDGNTGKELWVSDGTTDGTNLLADINLADSGYGSIIDNLTVFNDRLYFTANDGQNGNELWVTDGTIDGTTLFADINLGDSGYDSSSYARDFTEFDGRLYFTANDGETGRELWVTDGTTEGTQLLKDIRPGDGGSYGYTYPLGSFASEFTELNGKLYFTANSGEIGNELWVTNGTTEGTQLVEDLKPGTDGYSAASNPTSLLVIGNELFFSADNGATGQELFKLSIPGSIEGSDDSDSLLGGNGAEQIDGLNGQDTIDGGGGNDTLLGGNGNDILRAGDGDDRLFGGADSDFLDGGRGNNILQGDNGNDIFVITNGGSNTILDFDLGSDRLGINGSLQFEDLTIAGETVSLGTDTLATLSGVDATQLRAGDFSLV